jgi:hypothetical protein
VSGDARHTVRRTNPIRTIARSLPARTRGSAPEIAALLLVLVAVDLPAGIPLFQDV